MTYHFTLRDLHGLELISDTTLTRSRGSYQQPFRDRFFTSFPSNSGLRGRGI